MQRKEWDVMTALHTTANI